MRSSRGQGNSRYENDVPLIELRGAAVPDVNSTAQGQRDRPPEPAVKLDLLREAQPRAMVAQGKADAEDVRTRSGFLGGSSPATITVWAVSSVVLFVVAAASAAKLAEAGGYGYRVQPVANLTRCSDVVRTLSTAHGHAEVDLLFADYTRRVVVTGWSDFALVLWDFTAGDSTLPLAAISLLTGLRAFWLASSKYTHAHAAAVLLCPMLVWSYLSTFRRDVFNPCASDAHRVTIGAFKLVVLLDTAAIFFALARRWKRAVDRLLIRLIVVAAMQNFVAAAFFKLPQSKAVSWILGVVFSGLAGYLEWSRRKLAREAAALVEKDAERYDKVWGRLLRSGDHTGFSQALDDLAATVCSMHPAFRRHHQYNDEAVASPVHGRCASSVRAKAAVGWFFKAPQGHGNRRRRHTSVEDTGSSLVATPPAAPAPPADRQPMADSPFANLRLHMHSKHADDVAWELAEARSALPPGSGGGGVVVQQLRDLAVLFGEAATLHPHFMDRVAEWGAGGGMPLKMTLGPAAAARHGGNGGNGDDGGDSVAVAAFLRQHCAVKRRRRAIQKLFRSYGGNAARLIDLVRSGPTFDTVGALVECLERIEQDPTVAVLNVKNRLSKAYNSSASAGYRNVQLSLVVVDEFTMQHGVEHHVCELQLGLRELDTLKNDGGHRNYVRWRDARAE